MATDEEARGRLMTMRPDFDRLDELHVAYKTGAPDESTPAGTELAAAFPSIRSYVEELEAENERLQTKAAWKAAQVVATRQRWEARHARLREALEKISDAGCLIYVAPFTCNTEPAPEDDTGPCHPCIAYDALAADQEAGA